MITRDKNNISNQKKQAYFKLLVFFVFVMVAIAGYCLVVPAVNAAMIYEQSTGGQAFDIKDTNYTAAAGSALTASTNTIESIAIKAWDQADSGDDFVVQLRPGGVPYAYTDAIKLPTSNEGYQCFDVTSNQFAANLLTNIRLQDDDHSTFYAERSSSSVMDWVTYNSGGASSNNDLVFAIYDDDTCSGMGAFTATVEIEHPTDGDTVAQEDINALGGDAFYYIVGTDISATEYPGTTAQYEVDIYDDARSELKCNMMRGYTSTTYDGTHYGTQVNHFVDGECDALALGSYSVKARVQFSGEDWSDYSDWVDFSVGTYSRPGYLDCPDDPSIFSLCWWQNILQFLFEPTENAIDYLFERLDGFGDIFPISWASDIFDEFTDALDQSAESLGAVDEGDLFGGDLPNSAWFVEKIKMFYGDWAEVLAAFVIWLGAIVSILAAGHRLLNIDDDIPLETD